MNNLMAQPHVYLSLIPEALIVSMLDPESFGNYLAVGMQGKTRGQAMFFEVRAQGLGQDFPVEEALERCKKESIKQPKHSIYLGIYRVLERVPLRHIGNLYLATDDGRVLELKRGEYKAESGRQFHLYQELAPVKPRVVSRLAPPEFCRYLTTPGTAIYLPRLAFVELALRGLARDAECEEPQDLPYPHLEHLRDCLRILVNEPGKTTKLVTRHMHQELLYRTVRNGFFVGDAEGLAFYPMPQLTELETVHRQWWKSAVTVHHE